MDGFVLTHLMNEDFKCFVVLQRNLPFVERILFLLSRIIRKLSGGFSFIYFELCIETQENSYFYWIFRYKMLLIG